MKENDLLTYSQAWSDGKLSEEKFLEKLTLYILHNKKLLGLQKYGEDFIQDLLLKILETGSKFLASYDSKIGPFENYFNAYLSTLIHTNKKAMVKKIIESKVFDEESINNYPEKSARYELLELPPEFKPKAPYSFNKIEKEDFDRIFKLEPNKKDKRLLVLALKSSFYITDFQIENLCKFYELDPKDFLNSIQYCKSSITEKSKRREMFIQRRNKAYCYHKKYEKELNFLKEKEYVQEPESLKKELEAKNNKHKESWTKLNEKFNKGFLSLKPSNKTVAKILGISERQVCYYLYCLKHDLYNKNSSLKEIEENLSKILDV
ncbi:MAG: hypothetical protein K5866_05130 [Treponema sp.]|nr:hypothetical protein [Treponema sp.]